MHSTIRRSNDTAQRRRQLLMYQSPVGVSLRKRLTHNLRHRNIAAVDPTVGRHLALPAPRSMGSLQDGQSLLSDNREVRRVVLAFRDIAVLDQQSSTHIWIDPKPVAPCGAHAKPGNSAIDEPRRGQGATLARLFPGNH